MCEGRGVGHVTRVTVTHLASWTLTLSYFWPVSFAQPSIPYEENQMRVPTSVALFSLLAAVALPARAQSNVVPSDSIRVVADTTQPVTAPALAAPSHATGAALTGLRAG